jgi:Uma2 family endonuclease
LLDAYWRAGIAEYWLIDPRGDELSFDIFRRGAMKYVATRKQDGWIRSAVFAKAFRLTRRPGRGGISEYALAVR